MTCGYGSWNVVIIGVPVAVAHLVVWLPWVCGYFLVWWFLRMIGIF